MKKKAEHGTRHLFFFGAVAAATARNLAKHEGGAATNRYLRSDLVVRADRFCKRFKQVWEADGFRARAAGAGFGSRRSCLDARRGVTLGTAPRPRRHRRRESTRTIC